MLSRYEQFSFIISSIDRCVQKIERDEMIKYGYKGAFAQYLAAMNRFPQGLTAAQLGEICDRDKAAVSRTVAEMTEKGLITRAGSSYRARLQLTQEGRDAADFVCRRAQEAVEAGGRGLSDHDRTIFYAALNLIASNLEFISRTGLPQADSQLNQQGE